MDFSKVIEWNIPEGDVLRVLDSSNRIIWLKLSDLSIFFRDNIPLLVTYDYNFDGYKELSGFYSDDPFTVGPYNRTKPGSEFKFWNTKSDGTGDTYYIDDVISGQTDVNLYAQWELTTDIELAYIVVNCPDNSYSVPHFYIDYPQKTSKTSYIELVAHADLTNGASKMMWSYPSVNQHKRILYIKSEHGSNHNYDLHSNIDVWRGSETQQTYRSQRWYSVSGGYGSTAFGDTTTIGNTYRMIDDISYSTQEDRILVSMNTKPHQSTGTGYITAPKNYDITSILETYIFASKNITSSGVESLQYSSAIDNMYTFESYSCTTNRSSKESPIFLYRPYYEQSSGKIYLKDTVGKNSVYGNLVFPGRDPNKYYPLSHNKNKYKITGYDFEGNSYVYEFQGA